MSAYVLGILDGVAMLWFGVLNEECGKAWLEEKDYLKKWEGTLLVNTNYSIMYNNNKTIYIFTQETN